MCGNTSMLKGRMTTFPDLSTIANDQLLSEVKAAAGHESRATAWLIALLAQVDARRLYLGEGHASLFTYCTGVLHLSEHAAYARIEAARAASKYPIVLERLADRSITLTALVLLARHLTESNHREVLDEARHRSKREVQLIVARLNPRPDAIASVRREAAIVEPLASDRFKLQLTIGPETYEKLRRAQDLLRHSIPDGDLAAVFDRAVTGLLAELERTKTGATDRPRVHRPPVRGSRHIPSAVRREVWKRDGGQCAFVGSEGRCIERGFLEFHHVEPHAAGGPADATNIELRCRSHNLYEGERYFGERWSSLARESPPPYGDELGPDRVESLLPCRSPGPSREQQRAHNVNKGVDFHAFVITRDRLEVGAQGWLKGKCRSDRSGASRHRADSASAEMSLAPQPVRLPGPGPGVRAIVPSLRTCGAY
jgi:5-methylcytosine-specific restriction endonuclease McrA